jgi:hypothetical protein
MVFIISVFGFLARPHPGPLPQERVNVLTDGRRLETLFGPSANIHFIISSKSIMQTIKIPEPLFGVKRVVFTGRK